jgi:hypothetical protein
VAASKRWTTLESEVKALRSQFLPDPFDPLGVYPKSANIQPRTRAFLVLSHAEVESYLEGWAKEIARASESVWDSGRRVTLPLAHLVSNWTERSSPVSFSGTNPQDGPQRLDAVVKKVFQTFYKALKDNHGVKEKNVVDMFGPLGLPLTAISATLLPNLDAFGEARGTHAHHSARAVVTPLDPQTVHQLVSTVLNDLVTLDTWLVDYKRRIR